MSNLRKKKPKVEIVEDQDESKYWESFPKPWTKELCRKRYVEGNEISLKNLAKLSGVHIGSIFRWSAEDNDSNGKGGWVTQREEFQSDVDAATTKKIIDKKSDQLADILAKTLTEHHKAQEIIRNYLFRIIMVKVRKLAEFEPGKTLDELDAEIKKNHLSPEILQTIKAHQGVIADIERTLGWANYINPNTSIATLERAGYVISANQDEDIEVEPEN